MSVPHDVHELAERLTRDYERFSPAQQSLARYLVEHLADIPLLSAHEVARASHCSPATVVRFAQALGFAGYPEMQGVVRRAQRPTLPPRPGDHQLDLPLSAEGLEAALTAERLSLDDTARRLASADLAPLVEALEGAGPIVVAGSGHARPIVSLMEDRLGRGGRAVVAVTSLDTPGRVWLDTLTPGSAIVAIAVGREAKVAQAAVSRARGAGVPAVVLVDSGLSPLARSPLARVLPADSRDGAPSLVAMVAVAQALAGAVAPVGMRHGLAAVGA